MVPGPNGVQASTLGQRYHHLMSYSLVFKWLFIRHHTTTGLGVFCRS